MESIMLEILADNESALMNYYYFKNSAVPSMILRAWDNTNKEELQNTLESMKKNFSGGSNKHKIGILKGIDWIEKIQDSMSDMQFQVMRGFNTQRVCSTLWVPKVILWYTDGVNYTNANMQYKKFIENTVNPREKRIEWWINEAIKDIAEWVEFLIHDTKYEIDKDKLDMLEVKIRNWLITPNEARQELGYEAYEWLEEADQPLVTKAYDRLRDVWLSDIPLNDT